MKNVWILSILTLLILSPFSSLSNPWPDSKHRIYRLYFVNPEGKLSNAVRDVYKVALIDMFNKYEKKYLLSINPSGSHKSSELIEGIHWQVIQEGLGSFDLELKAAESRFLDELIWKLRAGVYTRKYLFSLELIREDHLECSKFLDPFAF